MTKQLTLDGVIEDIIKAMKKSSEKFILLDDFPNFLTDLINQKYGKFTYQSEVGMAIKKKLKEHNEIEVFRASNNLFDSNGAYTMSVGEYFVIRGEYRDVVHMKEKNKIIPMFFKRREEVQAWERGELNIDDL